MNIRFDLLKALFARTLRDESHLTVKPSYYPLTCLTFYAQKESNYVKTWGLQAGQWWVGTGQLLYK